MKARGGRYLKGNSIQKDEDFMRIYKAHKNTVFGIAFNHTKNNADANDVVAEASGWINISAQLPC